MLAVDMLLLFDVSLIIGAIFLAQSIIEHWDELILLIVHHLHNIFIDMNINASITNHEIFELTFLGIYPFVSHPFFLTSIFVIHKMTDNRYISGESMSKQDATSR